MMPAEILAMSGEVVSELWPDWWTPGRTCPSPDRRGWLDGGEKTALVKSRGFTCDCCYRHEPGAPIEHEIPPPDLTEPANFVRALKLSGIGVVHTHMGWCAIEDNATPNNAHVVCAKDSPELALLLALADLVVKRRK